MSTFLTKYTCYKIKIDNTKDNLKSTNEHKLQMSIF